MTASEQPAIACCLSADDYQHRIAWIEGLTREALQTHERDGLVLRLIYAREAAGKVREMVEQERICCAFLTFDLLERTDAVYLTITVPEAARAAIDILLRPFLPVENAGPASVTHG